MLKTIAENMMRSVSREFDENEHAIPWDYIEFMHTAMKAVRWRWLDSKRRQAKGRR